MALITIGIDFGTSFSFAGFLHGDRVMPLVPSKENWGIPSVFYYDGEEKYVGRMAERRGENDPENVVRSIKRNLNRSGITVGGTSFTPKEIVREILTYIVHSAEQMFEEQYFVDYDEIAAVISYPVDFNLPEIKLIRQAASEVVLTNGSRLIVAGMIGEPCAAAVEYFGLRGANTIGDDALVYDLGGGTFDVALVHANKTGVPYSVIDQSGDRYLGGDDWDQALSEWLIEAYQSETGQEMPEEAQKEVRRKSRSWKEDLSELKKVTLSVSVRGQTFAKEMTREAFEQLTAPLLKRTMDRLRQLLTRQSKREIRYLVLTGGSTYMPQIKKELETSGILPEGMAVRALEPERAIANGAARYADALITHPNEFIQLKAPHSYGIVYMVRQGDVEKPMIKQMIRKGSALPSGFENQSYMRCSGDISRYSIYESDVMDDRTYIEETEGRCVMTLELKRTHVVPENTKATQVLTLGENMELKIEAFDTVNGVREENRVTIDDVGVNL